MRMLARSSWGGDVGLAVYDHEDVRDSVGCDVRAWMKFWYCLTHIVRWDCRQRTDRYISAIISF